MRCRSTTRPGAGGEAGHVRDVAEDAGGASGADAVQAEQADAGRGNRLAQRLVAGFHLRVEHDDLGEQLGGELMAHPTGRICGSHAVQQRLGLRRGEEPFRPTRHEFEQQPVQPVHDLRTSAAELVAPIHQQPQRHQLVVGPHLRELRRA